VDIVAHNCRQERSINPLQTFQVLKHADIPRYLLNIHAIHNYQHINNVLPASLKELAPVVSDSSVSQVRAQAVAHMRARKDAASAIPSVSIYQARSVPGSPS
jgi:hypothetical protein